MVLLLNLKVRSYIKASKEMCFMEKCDLHGSAKLCRSFFTLVK